MLVVNNVSYEVLPPEANICLHGFSHLAVTLSNGVRYSAMFEPGMDEVFAAKQLMDLANMLLEAGKRAQHNRIRAKHVVTL